jgi:hypothetical protein
VAIPAPDDFPQGYSSDHRRMRSVWPQPADACCRPCAGAGDALPHARLQGVLMSHSCSPVRTCAKDLTGRIGNNSESMLEQ